MNIIQNYIWRFTMKNIFILIFLTTICPAQFLVDINPISIETELAVAKYATLSGFEIPPEMVDIKNLVDNYTIPNEYCEGCRLRFIVETMHNSPNITIDNYKHLAFLNDGYCLPGSPCLQLYGCRVNGVLTFINDSSANIVITSLTLEGSHTTYARPRSPTSIFVDGMTGEYERNCGSAPETFVSIHYEGLPFEITLIKFYCSNCEDTSPIN